MDLLLRLTASWDLPAISCSGLWSHAYHQNSPQVTVGCPLLQKPSVACGSGAGHQRPRVPWQYSSRWVRQASRAPQGVSGPHHKVRAVCTPEPATSPNKCATKALVRSCHCAAPGPAHSGKLSVSTCLSQLAASGGECLTARPSPGDAAQAV